MTARLHVLAGGGGVGKTTLAVALSLALAREGRRVGVLGIDPSRRLEDALGLRLTDAPAQVPGAGELQAAVVMPRQAIRRWAAGAGLDENPFFNALGDRLATATDRLAAVRMAEWIEEDPALTDLVVDTAPGLSAIDFVRAPERLSSLPLGALALVPAGLAARALGRIAGGTLFGELLQFLALAHETLTAMLGRIGRARSLLASQATRLLLVTSPRDPDARAAAELARALGALGLSPHALVVNRTLPGRLAEELATVTVPAQALPFVSHARALCAAQRAVERAARALAPAMVELPSLPEVQRLERAALADLGSSLLDRLEATKRRIPS